MIDFKIFASQIDRLSNTFGKRNFSDERISMIWESVKDLSNPQLKSLVDVFVSSSRQYPTPDDFARVIREKNYDQTKNEKKEEYIKGNLDVKSVTNGMQLLGKILDQQFSAHQVNELIKELPSSKVDCNLCKDEGEIFATRKDNSNNWVFKCYCAAGMRNQNAWPVFKRELLN